jgi:Kef-type K+ transport system membrane component KefB
MAELLFELGTVIVVATILAYAAQLFKQPIIIGYIAAGFLIGPAAAGLVASTEAITILSEFGIALLLFIVGLEMNLQKLKHSGMRTAIMGGGQVLFTSVIGYAIAAMFGFTPMEAFYIAVALTFSSTAIVIKLMSDKATLETTYGRLVLGMLLIQDVIAIFILALLPNLGGANPGFIALSIVKGIAIFGIAYLVTKTALNPLMRIAAKSTELLFLSAVSWLFIMSYAAHALGYSIAIGAFVAGVALASSKYSLEITSRVKVLRDFFVTIFFVSLGMQLALPTFGEHIWPALLLSLFVIIGNPLIVALLGIAIGYNSRVAIMSGLPMGQVSEFSLIVIALGVSLGHISGEISAIMVIITALTITATTYVIKYDQPIYDFIKNTLKLRGAAKERSAKEKGYDAILFGYNRLGFGIAKKLRAMGKSLLIVDFDPEIITKLEKEKTPCIYGDMGNMELLGKLNLHSAGMVISTTPAFNDNRMLIEEAKKGQAITVVTSNNVQNALRLYDHGASYVIMPHFLGGEHMAHVLDRFTDQANIAAQKYNHVKDLHFKINHGYEHLT